MDESGFDTQLYREYGRSFKGARVEGEIQGKKAERLSLIAAFWQNTLIAPWYFSGHCNTEVVWMWLKSVLLPCLKPGLTVIWDNASFHQADALKALIESAGCQLVFLPPYSPDLNPIEHCWAALKARIRRLRDETMSLEDALCQAFQ